MAWQAKPSGGYGINSDAGLENIDAMLYFFRDKGYTDEASAGIIGNCSAESALNPWRWQGDTVNYAGGYGLFQFTPARDYINISGLEYHAPNLSVTSQTSGSSPDDGQAQLIVLDEDRLSKWGSGCWRPYWSASTYAELYAVRQDILDTYGNGRSLTYSQFKTIDNVYYSTFAFLACYEGPAVPNMDARYDLSSAVYRIITGRDPDDPIRPGRHRRKMPLWMLMRPFI